MSGPPTSALAGALQLNQRCQIAVRPERIAVAAITAEEMGEGALPATLLEDVMTLRRRVQAAPSQRRARPA